MGTCVLYVHIHKNNVTTKTRHKYHVYETLNFSGKVRWVMAIRPFIDMVSTVLLFKLAKFGVGEHFFGCVENMYQTFST